ncbi:MAG: hypothetical protein GZ090_02260 [Oxalobacteraceae bacterium]|nr:hypothetical protein [Oxalobacteraceae bacterium]
MTSSTPDSPASSGSAQPLQHSAFYKFVVLDDPDAVVLHLRELTSAVLGSILVAEEGINGVLAGTAADLDAFEAALSADPRFTGIAFKRSACITPPFGRIKIHRKSEIVFMGVPGIDAVRPTGISVSPQEWRELIAADDVVVIDNRNSFEYRLGKFNNAVDPLVANFRDFPKYIEANAPAWQAAGKRVAMYCTGGIRCEKTSAWMQDMGMEIYQLDGGILNYFQTMPDADKDWQGECFVFDNRIALDTHLNETSTTLEDVYDGEPDGEWRLQRARRLAQSGS